MKLVINNQLIEYSVVGSGPTILMLHGWGQSLNCFDEIAQELSKYYTVIRFDFPGFGKSPNPINDWVVSDYVDITTEFIKKLNIDNIYAVIGHSFGGRVIIKGFDKISPQKIVLIGTAGIKPRSSVGKKLTKLVAKTGKFVTSLPVLNKAQDKIRANFYKTINGQDYLNANKLKKTFLNVINEDLTKYLPLIDKPTLLIWGDLDSETPIHDGLKMNTLIKGSKLIRYSDAGHFVFSEKSNEVIKNIEGFLNE